MNHRPSPKAVLAILCLLLLAPACENNVGRAFDPNVTPGGGGGGPTAPSTIQVVPVGGEARDGRPRVREALPKGGGWPTTVPIVVEFSESVNESSLAPTTQGGTDGRLIVRAQGTTQALPATYDFVLGGRVAILRPTPALSNAAATPYEVVLLPDGRDADGVRFANSTEDILATFTVDQVQTEVDGRILTVLPRDNARDIRRETDVYVVLTKPANAASVTSTTLQVRPSGGAALPGTIALPLQILTVTDPRVIRFRPQTALPAATRVELVVTSGMTFGQSGVLAFNNRTPFSRFDTIPFLEPTGVTVGNPSVGFPDQINLGNVLNLVLHVTTPSTALTGDRVLARIYGGDLATQPTGDFAFVERTASVPADGVQTVTIDFSGLLGTVLRPEFDDGDVTLTGQLQRGSLVTGYFHGGAGTNPRFDVTPPTLTRAGPPNVAGTNDVLTDQETLAFHGVASERIGEATLNDGTTTVQLFAASNDGRFVMRPLALGRLTAPRGYSITLTDRAGNMAMAALTGNFLQRGVITGLQAGTMTVEAYDDATLQALPGVAVVLDPGAPTVPPAAGRLTATTGADGRAIFTGLASARYTVTLLLPGYHLTTLYDSAVAYASLPLRPQSSATASFQGTAAFTPTPGTTALVGNNAFDDVLVYGVRTSTTAPTDIPTTAIRPFRPQVVTAFSGTFEPTATPAFSSSACALCGTDGLTATPPLAPTSPGGTSSSGTLVLLPSAATAASLATPYTKDFALATGLDTANLIGVPTVRVTASLSGFGGQTLVGAGFTALVAGASYRTDATYGFTMLALLAPFTPVSWVVTEARDTAGSVSRHRSLLNVTTATVLDLLPPPAIPTVTVPGGPSTGPPAVSFADSLNAATLPAGQGSGEVLATDGAGRQWLVLYEDTDVAGGTRTVQFPDLAGVGTGLALGTWQVRADSRLFLSTTSLSGDIVLEERRHQEATYARSPAVPFTVQ